MRFVIDYPMTIYATEVIEASDAAEAKELADKLFNSWEFFCERLYPVFKDYDLHMPENMCDPLVSMAPGAEVTMTQDVINDFIREASE